MNRRTVFMTPLPMCKKVYGEDAQLVLAREVTKTFETFLSGTATEILVDV